MTLQAWLVAIGVSVLGILLLVVASTVEWISSRSGVQGVLNNIGGALIASVGLVVLWELGGRRSFRREILETTRYAADIESSGVIHIGTDYLRGPSWDELFGGVQKLDVFVAYGQTWRNNNLQNLRKAAARKDGRIRVFLPDPSDEATIATLAERFGMAKDELIRRIAAAREEFTSLRIDSGAEIEIYYRKGDMLFSCYRFDNTAVITLYAHQRERVQVPTMICRNGGSIYQYVRDELKAIQNQSTQVHPKTV